MDINNLISNFHFLNDYLCDKNYSAPYIHQIRCAFDYIVSNNSDIF